MEPYSVASVFLIRAGVVGMPRAVDILVFDLEVLKVIFLLIAETDPF